MILNLQELPFTKHWIAWRCAVHQDPDLTALPSRLRSSQLISCAHSPHTVLQPTFVPWLLRVSMWERLVHFRCTKLFLNLPILVSARQVLSAGRGAAFETGGFLSNVDSSTGTRCTSSHSKVLRYTSQAMSCSSFDNFSSSFSCKSVSCSW